MIGTSYEHRLAWRRPGAHAQYFGWNTGDTGGQMEYNAPTDASTGGVGGTGSAGGADTSGGSNFLSTLLSNLGPIAQAISSVAGPAVSNALIQNAIAQVAQQQTGAANQIKNLLTQSGQNQQNYITGGLNTGTGQIMQGAGMANNALQQQEAAAQNTIQNALPQNQALLSGGYNNAIGTIQQALPQNQALLAGGYNNAIGTLQGAEQNQVGALQSGYGGASNTLQNYLGQALGAIGQGYGAAIGGLNPYAMAGGNALNALLAGYGMGPTGQTIPGATNMQAYRPPQPQAAAPGQPVTQPQAAAPHTFVKQGMMAAPNIQLSAAMRGVPSTPSQPAPRGSVAAPAPASTNALAPSAQTGSGPMQNGQPYQRDPALQNILMDAGGGMMGLIDTMHTLQGSVAPGTGTVQNPLQFSDPTAAIQGAVNNKYQTPQQTIAQLQAGGATPQMVDQAMGWAPGTAQGYLQQYGGGGVTQSQGVSWGQPVTWGGGGGGNALAPSSGSAIPGLPSFVRGLS
jgi:hypothetical protein